MKNPKIILFVLLLAGFLIRTMGLATEPPALNSDELLKSFDGASVYRTGMDHHGERWPLFFQQSGEYSPPLYIYFAGLFSTPFGINVYTVRLPSAVLGTLSIFMAFLFVRQIAGQTSALIAAALVTVSPWNVHYSRIGWEAISLVPLQLGALWLFFRWTKTERWMDILLSVSFWGLTLYAYPVARLSSLLFILGLAMMYARLMYVHWRQVLAGVILLFIWTIPYLIVLSRHYQAMQARWKFVSVFNQPDGFALFILHYFQHISPSFLFLRGNPESMHALLGGVGLLVLLPFFVFGLIHLIRRRTSSDGLLLFWFLTFAIPASLTYDRFDPHSMPNALRAINGVPLLEIISALGIRQFMSRFTNRKILGYIGCFLGILIGANAAYIGYDTVVHYPRRAAPVWQYGLREAVQYIESVKAQYDHVIVSHTVRLHPVALACFSERLPGPFNGADFPKYILPFPHYVPMYSDFRMGVYQQFGLISRWYTLARGRNLLLAKAGEIEGEQPLWQIPYPDGSVAYEIFQTHR